jgi:hypothetical protein
MVSIQITPHAKMRVFADDRIQSFPTIKLQYRELSIDLILASFISSYPKPTLNQYISYFIS